MSVQVARQIIRGVFGVDISTLNGQERLVTFLLEFLADSQKKICSSILRNDNSFQKVQKK